MVDAYTQLATYWGAPTLDGYGTRTFSAPQTLYTRWEDRTDLLIQFEGEEIPSKARVFVLQDVEVGGYLALGDQTASASPIPVDSAHMIKVYDKTPSLDGSEFTRKVML